MFNSKVISYGSPYAATLMAPSGYTSHASLLMAQSDYTSDMAATSGISFATDAYHAGGSNQVPGKCGKCGRKNRHYSFYHKCSLCKTWICVTCKSEGYYVLICLQHKLEIVTTKSFKKHYMEHYLVCSIACAENFEKDIGYDRYNMLVVKKQKLTKRCAFLMNYVSDFHQSM